MKKIWSLLLIFTLTVSVVSAQHAMDTDTHKTEKSTPNSDAVSTDGPNMVFESTEVNYGTIEKNSDPYRYFDFKNEGNEPLIIVNAKGSCGCTVPTYPKHPILPGETGQIKVRYDTKRIGNFTKTVTLNTNEADPKHVLRIKGKVEDLPAEPDAIPSSSGGF